jgi:molybdopterin molybdotransferase
MISVSEAKKNILTQTSTTSIIEINLYDAMGYASAHDIVSPMHFPAFPQSAMDGYGIRLKDLEKTNVFKIIGEEQTGNIELQHIIHEGETIRIFTGAKIPQGVDTVIQQEWVIRKENSIIIDNKNATLGLNIRPLGSQTKLGEHVITKGDALNAGTSSLLASLGIETIQVHRKPKIIIINTGKELVKAPLPILDGQVYESNSFALKNALTSLHLEVDEILWIDDDKEKLVEAFKLALSACDLLLVTGGVSVGDYDFVVDALLQNNVQKQFHKIAQKPGKPLFFGTKNETCVFGLPGNPASVLSCFYQYVIPCIRTQVGFRETSLLNLTLPTINSYEKKSGLTHFLKARMIQNGVEILSHQESYKMNTFAIANAMVQIEADIIKVSKGDLVKVYLLP